MVANFVNYSRWVKMRICSVQTVQRNMMCVCFLRETTFSEFDVDLILLLFIELFYSSMYFFFVGKIEKKHGGPWTSPWADPWASLGFVYTLTFEWHLLQLR